MRKTLAALAVAALALAGCSSGDEEAAVSSAPAMSEAKQSSGPTELAIGGAAHLTTDGENARDIDVTVTDIQVFEQCPEGELESLPSDKEGGVYVLVKWDTDVRETVNNYTATKWVGVGEGDTILETETAGECRQPEGVKFPGYVLPGTNASEGQVFWVSEKPAKWFLNEPWEPHAFAWPVPKEVSGAPEPAEATEAAAPESSVVEAPAEPYLDPGNPNACNGMVYPDGSCPVSGAGTAQGGAYTDEDLANGFEPAGTPPQSEAGNPYPGWSCDGPAYMCRDDAASGKAEGQGGY